jgi:hypothetical protein
MLEGDMPSYGMPRYVNPSCEEACMDPITTITKHYNNAGIDSDALRLS